MADIGFCIWTIFWHLRTPEIGSMSLGLTEIMTVAHRHLDLEFTVPLSRSTGCDLWFVAGSP